MFKAGYVGVIGKPNAGKSTLINKLVGYKVSITTPKPQTTRFNINGIMNNPCSQIVFVDTPGIHKPKNKMNEYMMKGVQNTVKEANVLVYLVDAIHPKIDEMSMEVIKRIVSLNKKTILCFNKIDKVEKSKLLGMIKEYLDYAQSLSFEFSQVIPISVYKDDGLDRLVKSIEDELEESEMLYDPEEITNITEREIVEENIREKLLNNLEQEVPHGLNVEITSFKERTNIHGALTYDIEADIICLRTSHKSIVLGKEGSLIRHITNASRQDLEKTLEKKINLKIYVKIKQDWVSSEQHLKNIKFRNLDK